MDVSYNYGNIHENAEKLAEARTIIITGVNALRNIEPIRELTSPSEQELMQDILKHSEEMIEKIDCLLELYLKVESELFDSLYKGLR